MRRFFLGWEELFITVVGEWLWSCKEELSDMLLVVPTAESGRKVRQALAERGACFAPEVVTAGQFGTMGYEGEDSALLEQLIWERVLLGYDWSQCEHFFPKPKAERWEKSLAESLRTVRVQTGEYGYTFHAVVKLLPQDHLDRERWQLLAEWEASYYGKMMAVGGVDSFAVRNADYREAVLPERLKHVVWVGVTDPTEQAVRMAKACEEKGVRVSALIAAPEEKATGFDDYGRPLCEFWEHEHIVWEGGNAALRAVADVRSLAACVTEAVRQQWAGVSESGQEYAVALGMGDQEMTPLVKAAFQEEGVTVYDPAGLSLSGYSFLLWFKAWIRFSQKELVADLREVLHSPWTQKLCVECKYDLYRMKSAIEGVCETAKSHTLADLWHLKTSGWPYDNRDDEVTVKRLGMKRSALNAVLDFLQDTQRWRGMFRKGGRVTDLQEFLVVVFRGEESEEALKVEEVFQALVAAVEGLPEEFQKSLDVVEEFLQRLEQACVGESRDAVHLEAMGWLELAFQSEPYLHLTGLNEGMIPNTELGDQWLPESLRESLGMRTNRQRYAHDVFYLTALLETRRSVGEVTGYFLKQDGKGDPLKPSRLLFQVPELELGARVLHGFKEKGVFTLPSEPRVVDWKLAVPPLTSPVVRLSPTSVSTYLQCPFRFYLKHVLRMQRPQDNTTEWDGREYGVLIHAVLEQFKEAPQIREELDTSKLRAWLWQTLDEQIETSFKDALPLAFRIQRESMRQRLGFFAEVETAERRENPGWRTLDWERSFELEVDGVTVRGVIDRVDKHEDGRLRLVDYKTGAVKDARKSHIVEVRATTNVPEHIGKTACVTELEGKRYVWRNLQLPIYALACLEAGELLPEELVYGVIGKTKTETVYSKWRFSEEEAEAAREAVRSIISLIKEEVFWPPAKKVDYDDFSVFSYGVALTQGMEMAGTKVKGGEA